MAMPIPETVSPGGLRERASAVRAKSTLNDNGSCARHLELAADEIERLREALKPFAEFAGQPVGRPPDDMVITQGSRIARRQLTMGDCARAAEALSR
jgi:hypothetical protein